MKIIHIHAEYRKSIASGENLTVNELSVIFNRSLSYYLPIFLNYEFAIQSRSRQILIGLKSLFSNKIGPIAAEFLDNSIVIIHNDFPAISIRIWTRILRKIYPSSRLFIIIVRLVWVEIIGWNELIALSVKRVIFFMEW